jgi:hypothetical protein
MNRVAALDQYIADEVDVCNPRPRMTNSDSSRKDYRDVRTVCLDQVLLFPGSTHLYSFFAKRNTVIVCSCPQQSTIHIDQRPGKPKPLWNSPTAPTTVDMGHLREVNGEALPHLQARRKRRQWLAGGFQGKKRTWPATYDCLLYWTR